LGATKKKKKIDEGMNNLSIHDKKQKKAASEKGYSSE
jgi:hypothetical protein